MYKHLIQRARPLVMAALLAVPATLASSAAVAGEAAKPSPVTSPAAKATKGEMTPEQHLAKAKEYREKAAAYRAEAAVHHKMIEQATQESSSDARVEEDSNVRKTRIHCEAYITKAEALATEAEKFADFHRMRAAELQGK